jgi:D-alanyl-lipoteichoic acid acyltransferase DltB (MBOAT superfamily)
MAFVPVYILILGFTIVIDYFAGIYLENAEGKRKKWFLIASLVANIGVLAVFKYYNFLNHNLEVMLHGAGYENPIPYLSILLPIGLSFHTFQAMSYTIEVYRGNQKAERHFGIYALYVMFYPQLVAGPIERPQNLLHQFYEKQTFDYQRITDGLKLMVWGLFKKVVIADRLAVVVDNIYNSPYEHQGLSLIIATFFFAFQIFCDFSGYSDMAIGAAQVMGFKLMKNFDRPYHARSIQEFWKRWHISLSTWFKDYLYISLGGNRVTVPRWYLNLFIVFILSGLWHGANWTFIVWGAIHGFYLVFALITKNARERMNLFFKLDKIPVIFNGLQIFTVFFLTSVAWVFFRARSLHDAFYILKYSVIGLPGDFYKIFNNIPLNLNLGISFGQVLIALTSLVFMGIVHHQQYRQGIRDWIRMKPAYLRWGIYYATILAILVLGVYEKREFIYFQF